MDYFCPQVIKDMFIATTDTHFPASACEAHFKWLESIAFARGDRAEVPSTDGNWYWWEYNPNN